MNRQPAFLMILLFFLVSISFMTLGVQMVKAEPGTIYIREDGSIDPPTPLITTVDNVTYTFTGSINDSIVVERDGVVLDGGGYTLQGTGAGGSEGINMTGRTNITIKNTNIQNYSYGLYLNHSSSSIISGNNIANNGYGIYLSHSNNNSVSGNNLTASQPCGIFLESSSNNNSISGNNITTSKYGFYGIISSLSSNETITGNTFTNGGLEVYSSYGNVVTDNPVNGKPLVYLEEVSDFAVADAGQVILVRCNNITVENLNLSQAGTGLQLWETNNSTISGNNITNNKDNGISLHYSSYNNLSRNSITNNYEGIYLTASNHNSIYSNNVTASNHAGIYLQSSYYDSVSDNEIADNFNGIYLFFSSNSSISGNKITNNHNGIYLCDSSSFNSISGNSITNNAVGIELESSSNYNNMSGNNITANIGHGIWLFHSSNYNNIFGNNIADNAGGIYLVSSDNTFYHNNFIDNTNQVYVYAPGYYGIWNDGYPSGGNYWSNYTGIDMNSGFYQNETDSDGIGDMPHTIDANNIDNYPLIAPISYFDAGTWNDTTYYVNIVSNSTLSHFYFNPDEGAFARFWVKGETETETFGFCRVAIPKDLLWVEDGWTVLYGSYPLNYKAFSDENYTYLYFTFTNPSYNGFTTVTINGTNVIPEFPLFLILPLFMTLTLLTVIICKRRHTRKSCSTSF